MIHSSRKPIASLFLLLALAAAKPCWAQQPPKSESQPANLTLTPEERDVINEAIADLRTEKIADASRLVETFLKAHPADAPVLLFAAYLACSRPGVPAATARPALQAVVDHAPGTVEAQVAQLIIQIDTGIHPVSSYRRLAATSRTAHTFTLFALKQIAAHTVGQYRDVSEKFPTLLLGSAQMWLLADSTARFGNFDSAAGMFTIDVNRYNLPWAHAGLAKSDLALNRISSAADAAATALKLDPHNADALAVTARILYMQGKPKEALDKITPLLKTDPANISAHILAAQCLEKLNKTDDAFVHYRQVAQAKTGPAPVLIDRQKVTALPLTQARDEAVRYLSAGRQQDAEQIMSTLEDKYPTDMDVEFMDAVLIRSRFDVANTTPLLSRIARITGDSPRGHCAALILKIDAGHDLEPSFDALCDLAEANPDDVMITWMTAIACRTLHRNAEGMWFYSQLLNHFYVGPSLVHQTFGNILDDLYDPETALAHRKLAVKLEPAGWAYDGLALSLTGLNDFAGADAAEKIATTLQPNVGRNWHNWGRCLYRWGHYADALAKEEVAIRLEPNNADALNEYGRSLEALKRVDEALIWYEKALAADPTYPYPLNNLTRIYESRNQPEKAATLRAQAAAAAATRPRP